MKANINYNAFNVYRRELAPGTVSLTGDRAQGDDSKHWAYSTGPGITGTNISAIILVPLIMTLSRGHTGQIKGTAIMR